jgi:hypothetical protein
VRSLRVTAETYWHPEVEYVEYPRWPGASRYRGRDAVLRCFQDHMQALGRSCRGSGRAQPRREDLDGAALGAAVATLDVARAVLARGAVLAPSVPRLAGPSRPRTGALRPPRQRRQDRSIKVGKVNPFAGRGLVAIAAEVAFLGGRPGI